MLQEAQADLGKQRVGEHVVDFLLAAGQRNVLFFRQCAQFAGQPIQLRLQQVGRAAGDHLVTLENALLQGFVNRRGSGAVLSLEHARGFPRYRLVTLTGQYVQHGLGADDL